jgi:hypothetical protein
LAPPLPLICTVSAIVPTGNSITTSVRLLASMWTSVAALVAPRPDWRIAFRW